MKGGLDPPTLCLSKLFLERESIAWKGISRGLSKVAKATLLKPLIFNLNDKKHLALVSIFA